MSHLRHLMWVRRSRVRIRAPILRTVNKLVCTNLWIQMLLNVTCSQWWSHIHLLVSLSNLHLKGKACVSWLNLAPKVFLTSEKNNNLYLYDCGFDVWRSKCSTSDFCSEKNQDNRRKDTGNIASVRMRVTAGSGRRNGSGSSSGGGRGESLFL